MSAPMVPYAAAELLERVVIGGDLSKLEPAERLQYYREVCHSLGLNPLTRPLEYMHLSGKLVLYARKDATDQLRKLHNVSVDRLEDNVIEGIYVVRAYLSLPDGRKDSELGAVPIEGLKGEARANAMLKATTKAKRRGTLSICGLGMLDETEVETIPAEALAPPKPPEKRADPGNRAAETDPDSGREEHAGPSFNDWMVSFVKLRDAEALEALNRAVHLPANWDPFDASQQVQITAAYNAAKRRLEDLEEKDKPEKPPPPKAPEKRADPVIRADETVPLSLRTERPPTAPLDEWLEAFTRPDNVKALEALWRGVTMPDLWETWSKSEQALLTHAKDVAKQRLGVG